MWCVLRARALAIALAVVQVSRWGGGEVGVTPSWWLTGKENHKGGNRTQVARGRVQMRPSFDPSLPVTVRMPVYDAAADPHCPLTQTARFRAQQQRRAKPAGARGPHGSLGRAGARVVAAPASPSKISYQVAADPFLEMEVVKVGDACARACVRGGRECSGALAPRCVASLGGLSCGVLALCSVPSAARCCTTSAAQCGAASGWRHGMRWAPAGDAAHCDGVPPFPTNGSPELAPARPHPHERFLVYLAPVRPVRA
jgi:hypothetical protein